MTATADRRAHGYEPDFDLDNAVGMQGQLFCETALDAIDHMESVEIKTDEEAARTGNVYLECRACMRGSHPTRGKVIPIPQFVAALVSLSRWPA